MTIDEFRNVDLRVGKVISAERVQNSEKLVKLEVSLGEEQKQIVSGIAREYSPENLIGKEIVVVANLESRKLAGLESQGMLLAAHGENGEAVILVPINEVPPGSKIT